jgi:hypothetical protein
MLTPDSHTWSALISSSVVPVVIISACGLLCAAFYNRLTAIMSQLRNLQRMRFAEYRELLRLDEEKKATLARHETEQYIHFLEKQVAEVLKKAHYMRSCLGCLIGAIFSLVLCSLSIGLTLFTPLDIAVLIFFLLGLTLLLLSLSFSFLELRLSLKPVQMESAFLQKLVKIRAKSDAFL